MIEHAIVTTYKTRNGTETVKQKTVQAEQEITIEVQIAAGAVDKRITVAIPTTTLKSLMMSVTKSKGETGDLGSVTVETNSGSAADDTFTISQDNALQWTNGDPFSNPIGTAVTDVYVSNPGTAACDFVIRGLVDPTP